MSKTMTKSSTQNVLPLFLSMFRESLWDGSLKEGYPDKARKWEEQIGDVEWGGMSVQKPEKLLRRLEKLITLKTLDEWYNFLLSQILWI